MKDLMIDAQCVSKRFDGQQVLDEVSLAVPRGEVVGLLGSNGSGKTTMIRLLNGVINRDGGAMRVGGHDPQTDGTPIRAMSGILTEGAGLYHELSGRDNLDFFAKLYGVADRAPIGQLLDQFELTAHQHKPVGQYSTGMKKRLGLAKALLHEPQLLFLDEPTNGLDPEGIQMVIQYLRDLNRERGTTILLCSHVLHQLESICHRYVFLEQGKLLASGTQQELETAYMQHVVLRVETGLDIGEAAGSEGAIAAYAGHPVRQIEPGVLEFRLPSKNAISPLLQAILAESWVHAADITNRSLEALYFEIRSSGGERHV